MRNAGELTSSAPPAYLWDGLGCGAMASRGGAVSEGCGSWPPAASLSGLPQPSGSHATHDAAIGRGRCLDGVLDQPGEAVADGFGFPAVEVEDELVEVALHCLGRTAPWWVPRSKRLALLRGAASPQPRTQLKTRWIAGGRRLASPIDGQKAIDPICRAGAASRPRWGLAEVDCLVPAGVTGEAGSCVTGSDGRRPDQQAEACLAGASGADARRPGGHDRSCGRPGSTSRRSAAGGSR
jgi:hypothetical protein